MNPDQTKPQQIGLLVVDLQTGVFESAEIPPVDNSDTLLANAVALLEAARAAGIPVVHVQHCGAPGDVLEKHAPGWPIHPLLAPQSGEPLVQKRMADSFENTDLHELLRQHGVTTLVVTGIQSEQCVSASCRRAVALGYRVLLARDGHSTWPDGRRTAGEIIEEQNHGLNSVGVELRDVHELVENVLC